MGKKDTEFLDLENKIKEVIEEKSETNYLEFISEMFAFDFNINGADKKEFQEDFINSFCDSYKEYLEKGFNEKEAKRNALYNITEKYLSQKNYKKQNT